MAIGKPRGKNGARPVFVYDPRLKHLPPSKRKVYVGSRTKLNGPGGAKELEREKQQEFWRLHREGQGLTLEPQDIRTVRQYYERWIDKKFGPGTKRPAPATLALAKTKLKPFLQAFGERAIDGGVKRREALDWSDEHPSQAINACAMYNDAINDELATYNPLANRQQKQPEGRKKISPITEEEVERLCAIALQRWGDYGPVIAAWILFAAWVGCRPGEIANLEWSDLDFDAGEVVIRRVKPPYNEDTVVLPDQVADAIRIMGIRNERIVFPTIQGKKLDKGSLRYYWDPVRSIFLSELSSQRRSEILNGRPDFDFYELRHACASIMADQGANEDEISHQLGNSPEVCRDTYIHRYEDRVRERNRGFLNKVVDLDEHRNKRSA